MAFKIIHDDDKQEFCIETPDGEEGEWAPFDGIATVGWKGTTFFATRTGDVEGMEHDKVYELGVRKQTAVEAYVADDEDEDEDEEESAVVDEEDEDDEDEDEDEED